jgi:hypothetical protein
MISSQIAQFDEQPDYALLFTNSVVYLGPEWWDRHLACLSRNDRQDARPTNTAVSEKTSPELLIGQLSGLVEEL